MKMEGKTAYAPAGARGEPLYTRTFIVHGCTEAQLTALALHMEDEGIEYDPIDTEEIPMCKTIVRETADALGHAVKLLANAEPGDSVAQNRKRLYSLLLRKWRRKLEELE